MNNPHLIYKYHLHYKLEYLICPFPVQAEHRVFICLHMRCTCQALEHGRGEDRVSSGPAASVTCAELHGSSLPAQSRRLTTLVIPSVVLFLFRRLNWWVFSYCSWKTGQLMISVAIVGCIFKQIFIYIMCYCYNQAPRDQMFLWQGLSSWGKSRSAQCAGH